MEYPKSITDLMESFSKLPSIGKKTAERLAMYVYSNFSIEDSEQFARNILDIKKNLKSCSICGNLSEEDTCQVCKDTNRNKKLVMVVETVKDLFVLEKLSSFSGVYHVLNGAINFSAGIGVEDLEIASLIKRIREEKIEEIILATNATVEGETTARYIKALLIDDEVSVTRIAHGLPVGGDLTYADEMTVLKALEGRRKY